MPKVKSELKCLKLKKGKDLSIKVPKVKSELKCLKLKKRGQIINNLPKNLKNAHVNLR